MDENKTNTNTNTDDTMSVDTESTPMNTAASDTTNQAMGADTTHPEQEGSTMAAAGAEAAGTASTKQTPWGFIAVVVVLVALLAGGVWWLSNSSEPTATTDTASSNSFSAADYPEVVATVNGEEITAVRFVEGLAQAEQSVSQQGGNPQDAATQAQMETQTITALVNTELMRQAAQSSGVETEAGAVEAEIASIEGQFEDADTFASELEAAGLTMEELRSDIAEQLLIDAYVRQASEWGEVAVSDAEVQEYYDSVVANNPDTEVPPFAEVADAVEQQLLSSKQQEATDAIIERLRAEADIEVLI